MLKTEHLVELSTPLNLHMNGNIVEWRQITLKAPTVALYAYVAPLKQGITRAILEFSQRDIANAKGKPSHDDQDAELSAEILLTVLWASTVDVDKYIQTFKQFLAKGAGQVDPETPLTLTLIEKFSTEDFEKILGEYLSNFLPISMMKKPMKS